MGFRLRNDEKLLWHATFAIRPRFINGTFVWLTTFFRKGKLVDGGGDHIGGTTIKYKWFHTKEEHFVWLLSGEEDKIVDETFWAKARFRKTQKPSPPPPPPSPTYVK